MNARGLENKPFSLMIERFLAFLTNKFCGSMQLRTYVLSLNRGFII